MDSGDGAVLQYGERRDRRRMEVRGQHARRLQLLFGRGEESLHTWCSMEIRMWHAFAFRTVKTAPSRFAQFSAKLFTHVTVAGCGWRKRTVLWLRFFASLRSVYSSLKPKHALSRVFDRGEKGSIAHQSLV